MANKIFIAYYTIIIFYLFLKLFRQSSLVNIVIIYEKSILISKNYENLLFKNITDHFFTLILRII